LEQDGLEIVCIPAFVEIEVSGEERTAIRFSVQVRRQTAALPGSRMEELAQSPLKVDETLREQRAESAALQQAE